MSAGASAYDPRGLDHALGAPLPARLGPYEVLGRLGAGGVGLVLHARDGAGREVALKVLRPDRLPSPERAARLRREGELTARLRHRGVVQLIEAGALPSGEPFLAYELVRGARDLRRAAAQLPVAARAAAVRDAALALGHAHGAGVVHRDVKPENVLVDAAGRVRVSDFGLAGAVGVERLTATAELLGSPLYTPLELIRVGVGAHGPASDVWALGAVLYEVMTGRHPFAAGSFFAFLQAVQAGPPAPPSALEPAVWRELDAACLGALAEDPAARPPHGDAFAAALDRALAAEDGRQAARALRASP